MSNTLSKNLSSFMLSKGIDAKELAAATGISSVTIQEMLTGVERKRNLRILRSLSDYFGIRIDEMIGRALDKAMQPPQFDSTADVLRYLMNEIYINEVELSNATGLSQQSINQILNSKTKEPRAKTMEALSSFFNISVSELKCEVPLNDNRDKGSYNPILNKNNIKKALWDHLKLIPDILLNGNLEDYEVNALNNTSSYALVCPDLEILKPRFKKGDILIIEYSAPLENGLSCIIQTEDDIMVGDILVRPERTCLIPFDSNCKPVKLNNIFYRSLGVIRRAIKND